MPCAPENDRSVDADHLATRGHQRAPGIAGIERGVGLDDVVDQAAGARAQRAAERRDDAGCHRRFEAERIADGDHELATFQAFGVAKRCCRQRHRLIDANERKIGIGIVADQPGVQILAIGGGHVDARRGAGVRSSVGAGDVTIGEDEAVRRNHDTRTGAAAGLPGRAGMDGKPHHGGADPVDNVDNRARISVKQRLIVAGDGIGYRRSPAAERVAQRNDCHVSSMC